jgi:hypothetical protein
MEQAAKRKIFSDTQKIKHKHNIHSPQHPTNKRERNKI